MTKAWSGVAYRSTSLRYANSGDLLSGLGSQLNGGRWNPIGCCEAIYASTMPDTAMDETLAHHRYYGLPIYTALPRVFCAINVRLTRVLPLIDGQVRRFLRVSYDRIIREDWRKEQDHGSEAVTQAIGRIAFATGVQALVVPSAASPHGEGLVIFPANGGSLDIINASELPP